MEPELLVHLTDRVLMYAPVRDAWGNDGWLPPVELVHCDLGPRMYRTGQMEVGREAETGQDPEVTTTLIIGDDLDLSIIPKPGHRFVTLEDGASYRAISVERHYDDGELHHLQVELTEED